MEYLPESTRLLYAQLLTECLHGAAPSSRGLSFVKKSIRQTVQWYLQVTVGNRKTQYYVGPDSEETRQVMIRQKQLWEAAKPDLAQREKLVAMLIAGGALSLGATEARIFELLEQVGVFAAGGVIVGSHAFSIYGNMLGVQWRHASTQTQDIDLGGDNRFLIGLKDQQITLKEALIRSEMGFVEVPALDHKHPSTKFRIRGKPLSVEILTPMKGKTSSKPVHLPTLNVFAEPVRFLDYLLEDVQFAVIVAKSGILANIPAPARYAFHKLVLWQRRHSVFQTKSLKDIEQAEQLFSILIEDRPGDIRVAWDAAQEQPKKFLELITSGMRKLSAETNEKLLKIID